MPLSSGTELGPYKILAPLGAGGMGEVYRARDTRLGREVAIKVLPEDISRDPARRQRFEHEARTAGSLSHPNLLNVFDVGSENGAYYIVTELVEGESLRGVMRHGPLGARRIAEISAQIADGLAVAHAAGIVHRDLKPENIMLGRDGRVRILDFGLAKSRARAPEKDGETATLRMTEPGTMMGTSVYMSPEQIRGDEVDGRSDLFSLAIVLYELAAGRRPFQKPTSVETMTAILREEVEDFPENLGTLLQSLVRRCIEKDPARRFQSAADLAFALRSSSNTSTTLPAIQHPPSPRLRWRPLAVAASMAVVGIASFLAGRRTGPEKLPGWVVRPITAYLGRELAPALTPDGAQIAFEWGGESGKQSGIYVRLVDNEPPLRVSKGAGRWPCWSPDGKRIAFLRGDKILAVPALGGAERTLAEFPVDNPARGNLAWSPDGNWIVTSTRDGLRSVRVQTGEIRAWTHSSGGNNNFLYVAFSPDGRQLAFTRGAAYSQFLYSLNLSTDGNPLGEPKRIADHDFNAAGLVWRADGKSLIVSATVGSRFLLWSVETRSGSAHTLPIENTSAQYPSISYSSGRLAYAKLETNTHLWRTESAGSRFGNPEPFIHSTSTETDVQFCPDGKQIVFRSERTGETAIWRSERDGSNQIPITRVEGVRVGSPRCSPDGRWIVFDGYQEGNSDLYVVRAEGGQAKRLTSTPWDEFRPAFTVDGKSILFGSRRSGTEVWKMPASGGEAVQITRDGGYEAFPSADGKSLFYTRSGGDQGIWRIPVEGGASVQVGNFGRSGSWAVAGGNLYWGESPREDQPGRISVFNPASGEESKLISIPPGVIAFSSSANALAVSPDEKTILFVRTDRQEADLMLVENFR